LLEEWSLEIAGDDCKISELGISQVFFSESRGLMMRDDKYISDDVIGARYYVEHENTEIVHYSADCIVTPLKPAFV